MSDDGASLVEPRPWREIAEQLAREEDSERVAILTQELLRALEEDKRIGRGRA